MKILNEVLRLIYPNVCGFCGKISNEDVCEYCLNYLNSIKCERTDFYTNMHYKSHFWLFEYKDEVRESILEYKFKDKSYIYRSYVYLILKSEKALKYIKSFDVVIPVPIHKNREKVRGYNQSELIAKEVCKKIGNIEYCNNILGKKKNIVPQSSLDRDGRFANIKGAYELSKDLDRIRSKLYHKKILLLDDVYTTGSTVDECAKVLKEAYPEMIGIITMVRG